MCTPTHPHHLSSLPPPPRLPAGPFAVEVAEQAQAGRAEVGADGLDVCEIDFVVAGTMHALMHALIMVREQFPAIDMLTQRCTCHEFHAHPAITGTILSTYLAREVEYPF